MEILGHSQIALTMNTYSHVAPEVSREAADRMARALWHDEDQADGDYVGWLKTSQVNLRDGVLAPPRSWRTIGKPWSDRSEAQS
jgi:hypothetical protein